MSKRIFEENQRFNQWWIWVGIAIVLSIVIYQLIPVGLNNMSYFPLIVLALVIVLILSINLSTRIDEKGIHVQLFPFHLKPVTYAWEEIYSADVVEYNPISDYGGWGLRISRKGKAFNVRGDKGIKIQTTDGRSRMIGTQQFEEAKAVVNSYKERIK